MTPFGQPAVADPRQDPLPRRAAFAHLDARLLAGQGDSSRARADAMALSVGEEIRRLLESGREDALQGLIENAPSPALARALWLRLAEAWTAATAPPPGEGIAVTLFVLPVVIVAGLEPVAESAAAKPLRLPAVLTDMERVAALAREHGMLAGCETLGFANALAAEDAVAPIALPRLLGWQRQAVVEPGSREVRPASIDVRAGQPNVSTRYLVGTALSAAGHELLRRQDASGWGLPLAQELARQLAEPDVTVLALPRPPAIPPLAWIHGQLARREVAAQLFVSDALRRLRARSGEPVAVISAHRCPDAPGGGELRLSLSAVFEAIPAEGFRCPLLPVETAADAATMLTALLEDCRVAEVHVLAGIHPDRDPATGERLLFRADALPDPLPMH